MSNINLLNNKGIKVIGDIDKIKSEKKTLIVVGVARGGTSLIAGTIHHLGVFTGEKSSSPVFEDLLLAETFENNQIEKAKDIIEKYNNSYDIWLFKRPASINYNDQLLTLCRNPVFLFVFKDIFSIANRNNISMKLDIINGLKKAHEDYSKIINFISNNKINGVMFSYEKVMNNKNEFINTLINIIGENRIKDENIKNALNFIQPNPKEYLEASRITRGIGNVDIVSKYNVKGWAKYISSDRAAKVELYINNEYVDTTVANLFREDLLKKGLHSTGNCGFNFKLKKPLREGDKVSVKLKDDIKFIRNPNPTFKDKNKKENHE